MTVQYTAYTKFLVGELAIGSRKPVEHTLTVNSNATAGASELTVAALTGFLAAGRKLTIGTTPITVVEDAKRGATTVKIVPLTTGQTIASAATTKYFELLEFIGGEGIDIANQDNVISIRNFKSGIWSENAKTMVGLSISLEGQFHVEDLAVTAIIRPATFDLRKEVYAEITRDNGDKWTGAFMVQGYNETAQLDNVVRVRFNLNSQGAIGVPAPASLAIA
jgi:predicted secreted protein